MPRPEDSAFICWVDLETTGNRAHDKILEVGAIMTTRDLEIVDELSEVAMVAKLPPDITLEPVVAEMHTINGLLEDAKTIGFSLNEIDIAMEGWIKSYEKSNHIPLAGSGVSHFDRRYIQKDLPRFNDHLSYWCLDVGVLRRTLKIVAGIDIPEAQLKEAKTHRALDDIRVHLEEMRIYRSILKGIAQ